VEEQDWPSRKYFSGAGRTTTFFSTLDKNPCVAVDGGWLGQSVYWVGQKRRNLSGQAAHTRGGELELAMSWRRFAWGFGCGSGSGSRIGIGIGIGVQLSCPANAQLTDGQTGERTYCRIRDLLLLVRCWKTALAEALPRCPCLLVFSVLALHCPKYILPWTPQSNTTPSMGNCDPGHEADRIELPKL